MIIEDQLINVFEAHIQSSACETVELFVDAGFCDGSAVFYA